MIIIINNVRDYFHALSGKKNTLTTLLGGIHMQLRKQMGLYRKASNNEALGCRT